MKKTNATGLVIIGCLFISTAFAKTPVTIGWIENVGLHPHQMVMTAKIDTGADNSSIHAEDISVFDKDGITMVSFVLRNKHGVSIQMEKPLVRFTQIKSKIPGAEPIERPVVEMNLCVGNTALKAPVNLANRKNFTYRMLIGRSYLKKGFVVDSNNKHLSQPACDNISLSSSN